MAVLPPCTLHQLQMRVICSEGMEQRVLQRDRLILTFQGYPSAAVPDQDCPWSFHPPKSQQQEEVHCWSPSKALILLVSTWGRRREQAIRSHPKEEEPEPSLQPASGIEGCRLSMQPVSPLLHLRRNNCFCTSGGIDISDQTQMFHRLQCRQDIANYLRNKCETLPLVLSKVIFLTLHIDLSAIFIYNILVAYSSWWIPVVSSLKTW